MYNFDERIDRSGTYSSKWDDAVQLELFGKKGLLPFWVADMEFKAAPEILDALRKRIDNGIFGYSARPDEYFQAIMDWTKKRFGVELEKEWILFAPGIVPAVNYMIQAVTKEGEGVIINQPVYYPFGNSIRANNRIVVDSPLVLKDNRYWFDFEDFETKAKDPNNKVFILCSPHNPVSRLWSPEELRRIGDICIENDVLVIADEIHNDLVFSGYKHTMFMSLGEKYKDISFTATAPSKTFNLAGFYSSNIIIPNKELRAKYEDVMLRNSIGGQGPLAIEAVLAAYNHGEQWLEELLTYLEGNIEMIKEFLAEKLPKAKIIEPEATYLAWIDFREYEADGPTLEKLIIEKAGVALDGGTWFGYGGDGFMRFNFAGPRDFLKEGLEKIAVAVNEAYK